MARHRAKSWPFNSSARHRAPGRIEVLVERGRHSVQLSVVAAALVVLLLGTTPAFGERVS